MVIMIVTATITACRSSRTMYGQGPAESVEYSEGYVLSVLVWTRSIRGPHTNSLTCSGSVYPGDTAESYRRHTATLCFRGIDARSSTVHGLLGRNPVPRPAYQTTSYQDEAVDRTSNHEITLVCTPGNPSWLGKSPAWSSCSPCLLAGCSSSRNSFLWVWPAGDGYFS